MRTVITNWNELTRFIQDNKHVGKPILIKSIYGKRGKAGKDQEDKISDILSITIEVQE